MIPEIHTGILGCIFIDQEITFVVQTGPGPQDYVEIEIGDQLGIVDNTDPDLPAKLFYGKVTRIKSLAFSRVPDGFNDPIVVLLHRGDIALPAILTKDDTPWYAVFFSPE